MKLHESKKPKKTPFKKKATAKPKHPMTITEKIFAKNSGQKVVYPGDLINAKIDIALGNDITAPIAINNFRKAGAKKVFNKNRVALVLDHFTPAKDIQSANQCKVTREFAMEQKIKHFYEGGDVGIEHALLPEKGIVSPGDVIVGADSYNNGEFEEGMAFLYHGSSSGLSTTSDWTGEGGQISAYYGFSVSTAGDVNGDGYGDVIVGANGYDNGEVTAGKAFLYYCSLSCLSATSDWEVERVRFIALDKLSFALNVFGCKVIAWETFISLSTFFRATSLPS